MNNRMFQHQPDYTSTFARAPFGYELGNACLSLQPVSLIQRSYVGQDPLQMKNLEKPTERELLIATVLRGGQINSSVLGNDLPPPRLSATAVGTLKLPQHAEAPRQTSHTPLKKQTKKTGFPLPGMAKDFKFRARALSPVKLHLHSFRKQWEYLEQNTLLDKKSKDQFVKEYFLKSLAGGSRTSCRRRTS
jgi:hypothetical protein